MKPRNNQNEKLVMRFIGRKITEIEFGTSKISRKVRRCRISIYENSRTYIHLYIKIQNISFARLIEHALLRSLH